MRHNTQAPPRRRWLPARDIVAGDVTSGTVKGRGLVHFTVLAVDRWRSDLNVALTLDDGAGHVETVEVFRGELIATYPDMVQS